MKRYLESLMARGEKESDCFLIASDSQRLASGLSNSSSMDEESGRGSFIRPANGRKQVFSSDTSEANQCPMQLMATDATDDTMIGVDAAASRRKKSEMKKNVIVRELRQRRK